LKINLKCCIKQIILFLFHNNESKCEDRLRWVFRTIGLLLTVIVGAFLVPLFTHCSLKSGIQKAHRKALNRKHKWRQKESLAQSESETVGTFSGVLATRAQEEKRSTFIEVWSLCFIKGQQTQHVHCSLYHFWCCLHYGNLSNAVDHSCQRPLHGGQLK